MNGTAKTKTQSDLSHVAERLEILPMELIA